MWLDLVPVAAAVLVLDHVAACGEVGDDAVGAALGDVQRGGDVAQAYPGVVGDATRARAWLVRKLHSAIDMHSSPMILEKYCSFMWDPAYDRWRPRNGAPVADPPLLEAIERI
jgi:hypothetical protein